MKSIRLSLMVYFLVLLAGGLGTVSVIVYGVTQDTLQEEEAARREMLKNHYAHLRSQEEVKFDEALEENVRRLSEVTSFQTPFPLYRQYALMSALGTASAGQGNGHLTSQLWLLMASGPPRYPSYSLIPPDIQVEGALARLTEYDSDYWQINTSWKQVHRSDSLSNLELPFDAERYAKVPPGRMVYDNPEIERGFRVRRVIFRPALPRFGGFGRNPRGTPRASPTAGTLQEPGKEERPASPTERGTPATAGGATGEPQRGTRSYTYYSFASDTTKRDETLAGLQQKRDHELDELRAHSAATLGSLRNRLLTVSLVTFALTVVGGLALVRFSLSPLKKLGEAVSRVSEKDVRLQLDDRRLPQELQPIVERLKQSLGLLHGALAREKQAAADISHELRTPLAALLTTTEVALRKPRSPDEYREVIQDCRASCQQMSRLVERLLALSRLDAGVDRLRNQEIDAVELADKCAGLVRPLAEARGLTLSVHRNGPIPVTVDGDKLREVLNNLLHNAIEYNQPRGSVEVAIEQENGHVRVEVRDTGIGMGPEALQHIFERFYRADPARQADSMHAGLGLAIVKGYLDLMGGTISVQSALGQGSTFRVQLPVRPHAAIGS